jgi:predicted permease
MFKNYFQIALRSIKRYKAYSFINIVGLAIGIACCILILLWVHDELSYDRFHENSNDIYRLVDEGDNLRYAVTLAPLAKALKEECPEVIKATRVSPWAHSLVKYKEKRLEQDGIFVDPDFFEIFTFIFIEGAPIASSSDSHSVIISEDFAHKCFGNEDPVGKIINIYEEDFEVSGVIENIPRNSHLQFDFVIPFEILKMWGWDLSWTDHSYYSYVQLQKDSAIDEVKEKINSCFKKHKPESSYIYYLQPLTRIHLYSNYMFDIGGHGDIRYIYIFTVIAIMILIIACINFVNLSTARSMGRAKEVGIRKVVGSRRIQLVKQFFGESILIAFISYFLSLLLVQLVLPFFNSLSGKTLSIVYLDSFFIMSSIGIIIVAGILAGSYPALLLSSFTPAKILRGKVKTDSRGVNFRKILVITQFVLSIGLIFGTIIISNQLNFMRNAKIGFNKENLIYLRLRGARVENIENFNNELLGNPDILNVAASSRLPVAIFDGTSGARWEGKEKGKNIQMQILRVDYNYIDTYEMKMAQGRFFSKDFSTDEREGVILNQAAIRAMEMDSPIGKRFEFGDRECKIIGIMHDFHYKSLREKVEPLIICLDPGYYNYLTIRVRPVKSDFSGIMKFLEGLWKKYNSDYPFEFHFLDETIDNLYAAEKKMSSIFRYFTFLAIFIACLGLFGLASYTTEQRTKEIGIRKVLGASGTDIVLMLTKDFTKLVLLATLIAWPVAYVVMDRWLKIFAYHISIGFVPFILAAVLALVIAWLTVSYQAIRAAIANPADSLRYE